MPIREAKEFVTLAGVNEGLGTRGVRVLKQKWVSRTCVTTLL